MDLPSTLHNQNPFKNISKINTKTPQLPHFLHNTIKRLHTRCLTFIAISTLTPTSTTTSNANHVTSALPSSPLKKNKNYSKVALINGALQGHFIAYITTRTYTISTIIIATISTTPIKTQQLLLTPLLPSSI